MSDRVSGMRSTDTRHPPTDLTEILIADAEDLADGDNPVQAELWASSAIGAWYSDPLSEDDLRAVVHDAVTEYLFTHVTEPSADRRQMLAVLLALAAVAPAPVVDELTAAAMLIRSTGVEPPAWATKIGSVEVLGCWRSTDPLGDMDGLACAFCYPGQPAHMLFFTRDTNRGGTGVEASITDPADDLVASFNSPSEDPSSDDFAMVPVEPAEMHARLAAAVADADADEWSDPATGLYEQHRALVLARLRAFPPAAELPSPDVWDLDRQRALHEEFLASPQAAAFLDGIRPDPDAEAATCLLEACAAEFIYFGCVADEGRPLRVSPRKCTNFLLRWVPDETIGFGEVLGLLPDALAVYASWAAERTGLPADALDDIRFAIHRAAPRVLDAYAEPAPVGTLRHACDRMATEDFDAIGKMYDIKAWRAMREFTTKYM
jgi:hypothetical protein